MSPDGWRLAPLSALALFVNGDRGKNYPSRRDFVKVGIPFINAGHIDNGRISLTEMNYITQTGYDRLGNGKVLEHDLVYCLRGSLGKVALINGVVPAAIASSLVILRPRDCTTPEFLYYVLSGPAGAAIARELDSGSAQPNISATNLQRYEIFVPPLPEQRTITAILSSVDEVIEKTEGVIEQLQIVKKAMMQELLTHGLPSRHTRFKKTKIGEIPEEWEILFIGSVCAPGRSSLVNGPFGSDLLKSELLSSGAPVIYIRDIRGGIYSRVSEVCVSEQKFLELSPFRATSGDVLIAKVGDPPGIAAIYPAHEPDGIVTQDVVRLRPDRSKADSGFLRWFLNSPTGMDQIASITIEGTRKRFALGTFRKEIRVPLPQLQEQILISERINAVQTRIESETQCAIDLRFVKSALMSVLLTGELRVTLDKDTA